MNECGIQYIGVEKCDMKFSVLTIFPNIIDSYSQESILGRAQQKNAISIKSVNIRDFADDKRGTVDDTPYGGGAGMVMKAEPIYKALKSIDGIPFVKAKGLEKLHKIFTGKVKKKKRTIVMSPRGRQFTQRVAEEFSKLDELIIICGRYEGIDQRVIDHMVDEEVSIGPYVLAGGELPALSIIEATSRLIPGTLGNSESLENETDFLHTSNNSRENRKQMTEVIKEYPQYTKPADFMGKKVPDVLLSGDHKKIENWRKQQSS